MRCAPAPTPRRPVSDPNVRPADEGRRGPDSAGRGWWCRLAPNRLGVRPRLRYALQDGRAQPTRPPSSKPVPRLRSLRGEGRRTLLTPPEGGRAPATQGEASSGRRRDYPDLHRASAGRLVDAAQRRSPDGARRRPFPPGPMHYLRSVRRRHHPAMRSMRRTAAAADPARRRGHPIGGRAACGGPAYRGDSRPCGDSALRGGCASSGRPTSCGPSASCGSGLDCRPARVAQHGVRASPVGVRRPPPERAPRHEVGIGHHDHERPVTRGRHPPRRARGPPAPAAPVAGSPDRARGRRQGVAPGIAGCRGASAGSAPGRDRGRPDRDGRGAVLRRPLIDRRHPAPPQPRRPSVLAVCPRNQSLTIRRFARLTRPPSSLPSCATHRSRTRSVSYGASAAGSAPPAR